MLKENVTLLPFGTNKKGIHIDKNNLNVLKNSYYGEIDHPGSMEILLNNVSHNITNLYSDNFSLYGDVKILDTHQGRMLRELVKLDLVVFRPRLSIDNNGIVSIYTFDAITKDKDIYYDKFKYRHKKLKKLWKIIKNI